MLKCLYGTADDNPSGRAPAEELALAEYREVLMRPRIQTRHRLSEEDVDAVLESLARNAVVATPHQSPHASPDPGDQHLWDSVADLPGASLITGDELLRARGKQLDALSPREFVELELPAPH